VLQIAKANSAQLLASGTASVVLLAVAGPSVRYLTRPSVTHQFWDAFLKPGEPLLFCIADQSQYSTIRLRDAADPTREKTLADTLVR
jgi:hypothetical protein